MSPSLRSGFDPAPLAESLSRHTVVPIPYRDPINWSKYLTALGALVPLAIMARYVGPAFMSRWTWAFVTLTTSLIMTSGFMFVRIRGMPRSAPSGDWIASGYQNQYGQETQVVAGICGSRGLYLMSDH
jgi:oligosaccharyltransferase complex subunit gamma